MWDGEDCDSWRRVALAALAPALQLQLARRMSEGRSVRVRNVNLGETLADALCPCPYASPRSEQTLHELAAAWLSPNLEVSAVPGPPAGASASLREVFCYLLESVARRTERRPWGAEQAAACQRAVFEGLSSCKELWAALHPGGPADGCCPLELLRRHWEALRAVASKPCAACGRAIGPAPRLCLRTCSYLCAACPELPLERPPPADEEQLRASEERGTSLSLKQAVRWAAAELKAAGARRVLVVHKRFGAYFLEDLLGQRVYTIKHRRAWASAPGTSFMVVKQHPVLRVSSEDLQASGGGGFAPSRGLALAALER
jgi:hypothetical protein